MPAHIMGVPFEEWLMPFVFSAGTAFVALRAKFAPPRRSTRAPHDEQRSSR
jgi:hypothetical protein